MKKAAPWIRVLFLALFIFLLRKGFLLLWLATYLVSLVFPLLYGKRFYCLLACPMNTLMLWISKRKGKLGLKNRPAPQWLSGGRFAWASLALTVAVFFISRKVVGKDFPMMVVWMVVASVMALFWHPDAFHDKVCPFGVPQGCLAKVSVLSEEGREKARNYQGFTASVLGGGSGGNPKEADKPAGQA